MQYRYRKRQAFRFGIFVRRTNFGHGGYLVCFKRQFPLFQLYRGRGRLQTQGFRPWASACRLRPDGSTESASGWKSLGAEPFPAGADLPLLGIAGPRVEAVPLSMNCAWRHCAFRSRRAPRRPSRWSAQHDGPGFAGQFARCGDPGRCDIVAKFNGRTPRHGGPVCARSQTQRTVLAI
jgi:hypothetical protein